MKLLLFRSVLLLMSVGMFVALIWGDPIFRSIGVKPQVGGSVAVLICLIALGWLMRTRTAERHAELGEQARREWEASLDREDALHAKRMKQETTNG